MVLAWHRVPLFLALHCVCVLSSTPHKRTYDTHDYFVLEHSHYPSLDTTAQALGVEVIEQVGQLAGHWLVRADRRHAKRDLDAVKLLTRQIPRRRVKRVPPPEARQEPQISPQRAVAEKLGVVDPLFPDQWHLINDDFPEHSMNVTGVWDMGLTGQGVISSLIDDGLDYTSADLAANFVRIRLTYTSAYAHYAAGR
jgi:kexin